MSVNVNVDAKELSSKITVNVHFTGVRFFQLRIKLACWIFALGAWIGGFGLNVEEIEDGKS